MISKPIRNKFILMKKYLFYIVLYLVIVLHSQCLNAQSDSEDVSTSTEYWLDYNMKYSINENKSISGSLGVRSISPHIYTKFFLEPTFNILHLKSLKYFNLKTPIIHSFHLGVGLFYTNNIDEVDDVEFRIMQGFQIFTPKIKGIFLKNYIRLEERFQKTLTDASPWTFGLRMRYKISTVFEWKKKGTTFDKGLYLPMNIEFFFNIKKSESDNDQIRISPGIGYKFNNDWRCEFSVSYQNTKNVTADDQTTNSLVFRLRLFRSNIIRGLFIQNKDDQLKELME